MNTQFLSYGFVICLAVTAGLISLTAYSGEPVDTPNQYQDGFYGTPGANLVSSEGVSFNITNSTIKDFQFLSNIPCYNRLLMQTYNISFNTSGATIPSVPIDHSGKAKLRDILVSNKSHKVLLNVTVKIKPDSSGTATLLFNTANNSDEECNAPRTYKVHLK